MRNRRFVQRLGVAVGLLAICWGLTTGGVDASGENAAVPASASAPAAEVTGEDLRWAFATLHAEETLSSLGMQMTSIVPASTRLSAQEVSAEDPDGDGAADECQCDVDGDGVDADADPTEAVFTTPDGVEAIVLGDSGPAELRNVRYESVHRVGDVVLPYGLTAFDVIGVSGSVGVVGLWPDYDQLARSLYKGDANAVAAYPTIDTYFDGEVSGYQYTVTDGGQGDTDGMVNGVVVDPAGPGYTTTSTPSSTSTTTTAEPTTTTLGGSTTTTAAEPSTTSTTASTVPTTSTTLLDGADPDGDGASYENPNTDLDGDGRATHLDASEAMFRTVDGVVALVVNTGPASFRDIRHEPTHTVGAITLPNGLTGFRLVGAEGSVQLAALWEQNDAAARTLYKGTSSSVNSYDVVASHFANGVTGYAYIVTDGDTGDEDGVVNGEIVDPVGPGYASGTGPTVVGVTTAPSLTAPTLARTGNGTAGPTTTGFAAIALGALLVGIAWRPRGSHYLTKHR